MNTIWKASLRRVSEMLISRRFSVPVYWSITERLVFKSADSAGEMLVLMKSLKICSIKVVRCWPCLSTT